MEKSDPEKWLAKQPAGVGNHCPTCLLDCRPNESIVIRRVYVGKFGHFRWTCPQCQRDYGYDTEAPLI